MDALCNRPYVVVIGGPTATGKTALSVALAKQFGGEIINADSMQIYKHLCVGTAKVAPEEQQGVPHHLLDFLEPEQSYSVADFVKDASACIQTITEKGCLPLLVGGTGLYISSLINGVRFAPEEGDPNLRQRLQQQADAEGTAALYARLQAVDPVYAQKVHPNNVTRVIRALELFETTGRRMSEEQRSSRPEVPPYRALCLCLTCRDRAELYRRIDRRVDQMMQNGLLAEAELVWKNRAIYHTAAQAIGYKEFFPYFAMEQPLNVCVENLKRATRRYAKRQLTWFRHQSDAVWLYLEDGKVEEQACHVVQTFLQS